MLKCAMLMPSFQGFITFTLGFILYLFHFFNYNDLAIETLLVFILCIIIFILSTIINLHLYEKVTTENNIAKLSYQYKGYAHLFIIAFLYIIGWFGVVLYMKEYVDYLGGIEVYLLFLFEDPLVIRGVADKITPFGIQLTYLAWIASAVTILEIKIKGKSRFYYLPILFTILLNLLFVDRTRPTWMIYTFILPLFLYNFNRISLKKIFGRILIGFLIIIGIFIAFKIFTGKESVEGAFGKSILPYELQDLYFYITSGYAYFNELVTHNIEVNYVPENSFYPFYKLLTYFNHAKEPPSQVLNFLNVGIGITNVGTMLQPYYQDGGFIYLIVGFFIQSFVLDYIGYLFLKNGNSFSIYGWSNLCFVNFIGFFTPKIVSFPIWLILIICAILKRILQKKNENIIFTKIR
jgi:oligosaccharide repeat unit polymerase